MSFRLSLGGYCCPATLGARRSLWPRREPEIVEILRDRLQEDEPKIVDLTLTVRIRVLVGSWSEVLLPFGFLDTFASVCFAQLLETCIKNGRLAFIEALAADETVVERLSLIAEGEQVGATVPHSVPPPSMP